MERNKTKYIRQVNNNQGFTIIEALIAISIFSIGFMALTATLWSSSSTSANTARSDLSIMAGQDIIESLSAMPIDHDELDGGKYEIQKANQLIKVEWEAMDFSDADSDGTPDFKTIVVRAFSQDELRMENYYRHKIN